MKRSDFPAPKEDFVITHFITVRDIAISLKFYSEVLGGKVLMSSGPGFVKIANSWIIVNTGGGPTDDKPEVFLNPPEDLNHVQQFLNIRVANIQEKYMEWKSKGATFLTEPKDHGFEKRCYMRDPDGYLIEVGEATGILDMLEL